MATIREKARGQWQVQIRCKSWPFQTASFRTKKTAVARARKSEPEVDCSLSLNQTADRATNLLD